MTSKYLPSLSLVVMLTAGAAGVFVVGFAYGYEADPGGPPPPGHAGHTGEMPPPMPGALVEAHLAFLKTALDVTDAQLSAWNGVAEVLRDQAKRCDTELSARRSAAPPADLVAAMQERQRSAVEESDDLSKLLTVLKPFYEMLNAEQKETADHLFPPGPPDESHGGSPGPKGEGPFSQCQPLFRHEMR